MAQEININPTPTGQSASGGRSRMMVSDTTLAEQFCMVASDIRSLLSSMKTSVDIQRQMVESFEIHSNKLDDTLASIVSITASIVSITGVLEDMIEKNSENVAELKNGTQLLVAALGSIKTS
jgi:hypothetical protein